MQGLKDNFSRLVEFSLNISNILFHFLLTGMVSEEKFDNLTFVSLEIRWSFSSGFCQYFFLCLWYFYSLKMIHSGGVFVHLFLAFILLGVLWDSWIFPSHICYTFGSCPTILGYSILFYFSLYFLCSLVLKSSTYIFSSTEILSSAPSSLIINPSKAFFILVIVILIFSVSFWFFLRISITLLTSIQACCLPDPLKSP